MTTVSIDKGLSWAVPIGGFISNFIVGGLAKSYGMIIMATQELFDTSAAPLTLAGGLIYTFMYSFSLVGIFLSQKYGCRTIVMIGGIGCACSFMGAFFARSVTVWVICIGGGVGLSLSFIYSPIFVMIGRCFKYRVGIAMGISVAGVSVGQMAFPYIITSLIDAYGNRGVFMVGSGIALHFAITAMLMPRYIKEELEDSSHNKYNTVTKFKDIKLINDAENNKFDKSKRKSFTCNFTTIQIVMLVIFVLSKIFGDIGDVGLAIALPPFGDTSGFSENDISLAIGVAGGLDLVTRFIIGFVSDKPWCRRSVLLMSAWLLEAINTFLFLSSTSRTNFVIFYGIFGVCSGTAITLMTVVLTDLVGQQNLAVSFAIMMLILGLLIGIGQYFIGHLADITGNYEWSLRFLGINLFLAFIILALEYPLKKIFDKTIARGRVINNNNISDKQDPSTNPNHE